MGNKSVWQLQQFWELELKLQEQVFTELVLRIFTADFLDNFENTAESIILSYNYFAT